MTNASKGKKAESSSKGSSGTKIDGANVKHVEGRPVTRCVVSHARHKATKSQESRRGIQ